MGFSFPSESFHLGLKEQENKPPSLKLQPPTMLPWDFHEQIDSYCDISNSIKFLFCNLFSIFQKLFRTKNMNGDPQHLWCMWKLFLNNQYTPVQAMAANPTTQLHGSKHDHGGLLERSGGQKHPLRGNMMGYWFYLDDLEYLIFPRKYHCLLKLSLCCLCIWIFEHFPSF